MEIHLNASMEHAKFMTTRCTSGQIQSKNELCSYQYANVGRGGKRERNSELPLKARQHFAADKEAKKNMGKTGKKYLNENEEKRFCMEHGGVHCAFALKWLLAFA